MLVKSLRKREIQDYTVRFELDEDVLTDDAPSQYKTFQNVYNIIDIYNNYFIDRFGNKMQVDDLVSNTNFIVHRKGGDKYERANLGTKLGMQLHHDLMVYMQYKKSQISKVPDEERQQYAHFKYTENIDVRETEIYKQFNKVWGEWGLVDIVDNTPIIDAMCKIIGYIFTPNRAWRYFAVLESTCSGWGKTAFVNAICDNTDAYTHYIPSTIDADKYSYGAMYQGKDVCVIDDPGKNMHDLAGEINNIVSTKRGCVRAMKKDPYTADGVETRIVVTTNIPFRVKQDLMLDNKMICVKTNSIESRNDSEQEIIHKTTNKYINQASREDIDKFISGCIDLLASDGDWIKSHLGLHTDEEELGCKMAQLLRITKVNDTIEFPTDANTLEDLVSEALKTTGFEACNESRYANYKFAYIDICKELKTKCYEDRCLYNGKLVFMNGKQTKDRCRNFKLTDSVKSVIISAVSKCDDSLDFISQRNYI